MYVWPPCNSKHLNNTCKISQTCKCYKDTLRHICNSHKMHYFKNKECKFTVVHAGSMDCAKVKHTHAHKVLI